MACVELDLIAESIGDAMSSRSLFCPPAGAVKHSCISITKVAMNFAAQEYTVGITVMKARCDDLITTAIRGK